MTSKPVIASFFLLLSISAGVLYSQSDLPPPIEAPPSLRSTSPEPGASTTASTVPSTSVSPDVTSSTSATKQFIVHGADLTTRGTYCVMADDISEGLGRLLKDGGQFSLPIVIALKTPPDVQMTGPAVTTNISQLAYGGFHLQLNVQLRHGYNIEDFTQELIRVLLAERILRNHKELNTPRSRVLPDWLLTGVAQALDFRSRSRPSVLFAAVFRSGQVYSVDRILEADPFQMDALTRGIYEASSCALILTLLEQPDGSARFGRFLNSLASDPQSDRDLLKQHFPTLGASKNSLEKWWSLQMATLATPTPFETMSVTETERELERALSFEFKDKTRTPAPKKETVVRSSTPESDPEPGSLPLTSLSPSAPEEATPLPPTPPPAATSSSTPESKSPPKPTAEAEEKPKTEAPAPAPAPEKPETKTQAPKEEKKDDSKPDPEADKPSGFRLRDLFKPRSKDVVFPFTKRKTEGDEPGKEENAKEDKNKEAPTGANKNEKETPKQQPPVKKTETPPPASAPVPAPVKEDSKPKEDGESSDQKKSSPFNPMNWFRKDEGTGEEAPKAETEKDKNKSASHSERPARSRQSPTVTESSSSESSEMVIVPLSDFTVVLKRSDKTEILQRTLDRLNALKLRCHPLYRPLIADYIQVITQLLTSKPTGVAEKITALTAQHKQVREQAAAVESYLDWYEASQSSGYSSNFDDYLKLREQLDEEKLSRSDRLSRYLDNLDKEYQ